MQKKSDLAELLSSLTNDDDAITQLAIDLSKKSDTQWSQQQKANIAAVMTKMSKNQPWSQEKKHSVTEVLASLSESDMLNNE